MVDEFIVEHLTIIWEQDH